MKKKIFDILVKYFRKEIEQSYIEQQFPSYQLSTKDESLIEKISDLARTAEFRLLEKLLINKKNTLGRELLVKKFNNEKAYVLQREFYRGQAFIVSHFIALIKHINRIHQLNKERGEKSKKSEKESKAE